MVSNEEWEPDKNTGERPVPAEAKRDQLEMAQKSRPPYCIGAIAAPLFFLGVYLFWLPLVLKMTGSEISQLIGWNADSLDAGSLASLVKLISAPSFVILLVLAAVDSALRAVWATSGNSCHERGQLANCLLIFGAILGFLCLFAIVLCVIVMVCFGLTHSVDVVVVLVAQL